MSYLVGVKKKERRKDRMEIAQIHNRQNSASDILINIYPNISKDKVSAKRFVFGYPTLYESREKEDAKVARK